LTAVHARHVYDRWLYSHSLLEKRILGGGIVSEMNLEVSCQLYKMDMMLIAWQKNWLYRSKLFDKCSKTLGFQAY
jgi:hypothetical protein